MPRKKAYDMRERLYNFSAGPAILPEEVLHNAKNAIWTYQDSGIGILEHSHRGEAFTQILSEAISNCKKIANVGTEHEILFLQGGASSQFFMAPMNWLTPDKTADYIHTGTWSKKAITEAKRYGNVHIAASSEEGNFQYVPTQGELNLSEDPRYLHYTSNNTIAGTQFSSTPAIDKNIPLLCDASSDIFSRSIAIDDYAMLYAGAQKNLGPSGVALAIIRKDMIEQGNDSLASMLQYRTHSKANSCFNTPPAFGIYIMGEVFKWILAQGGLAAMEERNTAKAEILYNYLDQSTVFFGTARKDSRSKMNVTFRAHKEELEAQFIKEATAKGLPGLKGHRSIGGMRASIYNAFPIEGVQALVNFMKEFEQKNH